MKEVFKEYSGVRLANLIWMYLRDNTNNGYRQQLHQRALNFGFRYIVDCSEFNWWYFDDIFYRIWLDLSGMPVESSIMMIVFEIMCSNSIDEIHVQFQSQSRTTPVRNFTGTCWNGNQFSWNQYVYYNGSVNITFQTFIIDERNLREKKELGIRNFTCPSLQITSTLISLWFVIVILCSNFMQTDRIKLNGDRKPPTWNKASREKCIEMLGNVRE